jgi:acyl-coenzyme A synthetase/AMP-(fatty) acid ligase
MIIDHIYEWARVEPFKAALIHNDRVIDYITYAKTIEAMRRCLGTHGLPAGTSAIVLVRSLAAAWPLNMALRSLGLTTIQANSLTDAKALWLQLKNASCIVAIAGDQSAHGLAGGQLAGPKLILLSSRDLAAAAVLELPPSLPSDQPSGGHILSTSGTTGAHKRLMWESELEEARTSARSRTQGFSKNTVAHVWSFGQWTGPGWKIPMSVWRSGGCVVFDQRPDWHARFLHHPITAAFMLPPSLRELMDAIRDKPSRCEFLILGGSLPPAITAKAVAIFGSRLTSYYMAGELGTPALISRIRHQEDALWLEVAADRTVQVVDEDGLECLPGQEGDLRVGLTDLDSNCYLDDEQTTAKVFRNGFFYSGDRAVRRADGRIRILGRVADVLNVGGQKIALGPIEQRLQEYLNVDEVCVFSGLNAASDVELVIAMKSDIRPSQEKLDRVNRSFASFDKLARVDKVRFEIFKDFPRTHTGKVRRVELRKIIFPESGQFQGG